MECNSVHHLFSKLSCLCSHPLFSTIVTLYTLILLYIPSFFLRIALSPVLNSTGIILISLLRLGTLQKESRFLDSSDNERSEKESSSLESGVPDSNLILCSSFAPKSKSTESKLLDIVAQNETHAEFEPKSGLDLERKETHVQFEHDMGLESNSMESSQVMEERETTYEPKSGLDLECNQTHVEFEHNMGLESNSMETPQALEGEPKIEMDPKQVDTTMAFLEWNMRAPLEIIYEAYEGEEDDDDDEESNENHAVSNDKQDAVCQRYPSLLMYYPDSETDSSSDGEFPMNEKWETHESVFFKWEDEEEEREELIEISLDHYGKKTVEFCHVEEDNLIEIDLFHARN
ncbi:hypothetical protein L1887_34637 [Cichorium endivia]|nr:hypothetical protein L1887_34637 [Cichorium endivia]